MKDLCFFFLQIKTHLTDSGKKMGEFHDWNYFAMEKVALRELKKSLTYVILFGE